MKKYAKRRTAEVYQPSDAVSVLAIAATAIILVLSLFAMERYAGVPVSVRGESASAPSESTTGTRVRRKITAPRKTSRTADRAAARRARVPATSSSSAPAVTNTTCANALCSNLLNPLIESGSPECMRSQQCVDIVAKIIKQPDCVYDSTCRTMYSMYSFYYSRPDCVTNFSTDCRLLAEQLVRDAR